jgi:hypothetical protein
MHYYFDFFVLKFGCYQNNVYICSVKSKYQLDDENE